MGELLISLRAVRRNYHGLRPLRVEHLELREAETIGLLGFDAAAAEVLVNLITGATLPDAGDVEVFGSPTRDVGNSDEWLQLLERFGILSERVFLLDQLTVGQNLAIPLSLEVDAIPPDVAEQIRTLAAEVGIAAADLRRPAAQIDAETRIRVRLGRALALDPEVLLAEHPTAALPPAAVGRFAADLSALAARRSLAMLVVTADAGFANAACSRVLSLRGATGELAEASRRWNWPWKWLPARR